MGKGQLKNELRERRKAGRPRVYDPEKIMQEMIEWVEDDMAISFCDFCYEHGYLPGLIWRLEQENEDFEEAYTFVKMKLAERRERLMNAECLNYGSWARYQGSYDPFLEKHETKEKDEDAKRRKGIVEAEQMNLVTLAKMAAAGEIAQK